jgi:hypothetical protein
MATPYLAIEHIAASQNQKEVTANGAFDALDAAMNAQASFAMSDADLALTQAQVASATCLVLTGALTVDHNVTVPAIAREFAVKNSTSGGHNITVKTPSGSGISIAAADGFVMLFCDGTNVVAIGTATSGGAPVTSVFGRTGAVVAVANDYTEAQLSFTDILTNDVSITKHGFAPRLPNDATKYLDGTGAWTSPPGTGGGVPNFADAEVPGGAINGSNTAFTLAHSPTPAASLILVLNGLALKAGGVDYTLSGANITMAGAPSGSDTLVAWYRY